MSGKDLQTLLKEIKRLCKRATPGPWLLEGEKAPENVDIYDVSYVISQERAEDVKFISHARTALPRLVAALELALEYDNGRIDELFKLTDPMFDTVKEMKARRDAELARVLEG